MLQLEVAISPEGWDEKTEQFVEPKFVTLRLEHSLVSISKWESKWNKSFLSSAEKTDEEIFDYIKCMSTTSNVDPDVFDHLTEANIRDIQQYINAPMTATTIREDSSTKRSREIVTNELIYYWMFSLGIPKELEKWHLNRLITLIKVFNAKNDTPKKRNRRDVMSQNAKLNAARRQRLNSRG
jgi:hypothetical protein